MFIVITLLARFDTIKYDNCRAIKTHIDFKRWLLSFYFQCKVILVEVTASSLFTCLFNNQRASIVSPVETYIKRC